MPQKAFKTKITTGRLFKRTRVLYAFPRKERSYLYLLFVLITLCALAHPYAEVAMWLAFALAAYSSIANDSIQTIGTFISSNIRKVRWYYMWLFMASIFVATTLYSWWAYDGDISHQRLHNKGLDVAPTSFSFLQLFAPLMLLILTRLRIPVSTSILLISAFATSSATLGKILVKSMLGYLIAFVVSVLIWYSVSSLIRKGRLRLHKNPAKWWYPVQWVVSSALWSVWIMQDMANFAIVLPRSLSPAMLGVVVAYVVIGLGLLFYLRGDKIQRIVEEKSMISDVRVATLIDLSYALILYYLKGVSNLPLSTTWVFIGLLGGRELGLTLALSRPKRRRKRYKYSLQLIAKDVFYVSIGLVVSLLLSLGINQQMREEVFSLFGG